MKSLLPLFALTLCASAAVAQPALPSSTLEAAQALVSQKLIAPRAKLESKRSRFSRAAPVPLERRVRVLATSAEKDARGKEFVAFAIDERRPWDEEGVWQEAATVGCVYPKEREVFVRRGDAFFPARGALGEQVRERAGVCRPAPPDSVL